tara:strand:+ start:3837 stop:4070 length:234 start_codon:yes stop_codon:yes gene_type:complete
LGIGLENIETMSETFTKNTLGKIKKLKLFNNLSLFKINKNKSKIKSKIKILKNNSNIIHNNCGTPNCCGQCKTTIRN